MELGGKQQLQKIYKRYLTPMLSLNSLNKTVKQLGTWLKAAHCKVVKRIGR